MRARRRITLPGGRRIQLPPVPGALRRRPAAADAGVGGRDAAVATPAGGAGAPGVPARKPHVGLVAFYFPPSRASGVYRMLALANHLVAHDWDVTVFTVTPDFFEHITRSSDPTLLKAIDPRVQVERVPLPMRHLEQDLRRYGRWRGNFPEVHSRVTKRLISDLWCDQYGSWVPGLLRRLLLVHRRHRLDLTLATGNPYSSYQAVWAFRRMTGVPYVLDSRDSWTLNLFTNEPAFPPGHASLTWEERTFADAKLISFVNRPLLRWHQRAYPGQADRMFVVANGYDPAPEPTAEPTAASTPAEPGVDEAAGAVATGQVDAADSGETPGQERLRFGYVGTLTANQPHDRVWAGWRLAKDAGRVDDAIVDLYGHLGFFGVSAAVRNALPLDDPSQEVTWQGAVGKADIAAAYDALDVLVMIVADSPYVTSGKVFEYMSTGKVVLGLYQAECAVAEVLDEYPLLVRTRSLEPPDIADAFVAAAQRARTVSAAEQEAAREYATRFRRSVQLDALEERLRAIVGR